MSTVIANLVKALESTIQALVLEEVRLFGELKALPATYTNPQSGKTITRRVPAYGITGHISLVGAIDSAREAIKGTDKYITVKYAGKNLLCIGASPSQYNNDTCQITLTEETPKREFKAFVFEAVPATTDEFPTT